MVGCRRIYVTRPDYERIQLMRGDERKLAREKPVYWTVVDFESKLFFVPDFFFYEKRKKVQGMTKKRGRTGGGSGRRKKGNKLNGRYEVIDGIAFLGIKRPTDTMTDFACGNAGSPFRPTGENRQPY